MAGVPELLREARPDEGEKIHSASDVSTATHCAGRSTM